MKSDIIYVTFRTHKKYINNQASTTRTSTITNKKLHTCEISLLSDSVTIFIIILVVVGKKKLK